jgi:hypothetical protein
MSEFTVAFHVHGEKAPAVRRLPVPRTGAEFDELLAKLELARAWKGRGGYRRVVHVSGPGLFDGLAVGVDLALGQLRKVRALFPAVEATVRRLAAAN